EGGGAVFTEGAAMTIFKGDVTFVGNTATDSGNAVGGGGAFFVERGASTEFQGLLMFGEGNLAIANVGNIARLQNPGMGSTIQYCFVDDIPPLISPDNGVINFDGFDFEASQDLSVCNAATLQLIMTISGIQSNVTVLQGNVTELRTDVDKLEEHVIDLK
ncbi:unnamed protein product, partial [Chrysoparadoxa australica]